MVQINGKVWIKTEGIANEVYALNAEGMQISFEWIWTMQHIHISVDSKRLNLKISILS